MKLTVNGAQYTVAPDWQEETLLTVLREHWDYSVAFQLRVRAMRGLRCAYGRRTDE